MGVALIAWGRFVDRAGKVTVPAPSTNPGAPWLWDFLAREAPALRRDTSPGEQIISSKLLAYTFLLSIEGYPFTYGKDYFGGEVWPGAYGLKRWIEGHWLAQLSRDCLGRERSGFLRADRHL